jgi:hypothetical protein
MTRVENAQMVFWSDCGFGVQDDRLIVIRRNSRVFGRGHMNDEIGAVLVRSR